MPNQFLSCYPVNLHRYKVEDLRVPSDEPSTNIIYVPTWSERLQSLLSKVTISWPRFKRAANYEFDL